MSGQAEAVATLPSRVRLIAGAIVVVFHPMYVDEQCFVRVKSMYHGCTSFLGPAAGDSRRALGDPAFFLTFIGPIQRDLGLL
jgi:hypothetical protein